MTRVPFIAGNWKMNPTTGMEAARLLSDMRDRIEAIDGVQKGVFPPAIYLKTALEILDGSGIVVGAQNCHWEAKGAFTGELSPVMLRELVDWVIIGHSERRQYFGETDETVNRRVKGALAAGLRVIMCIGETREERAQGRTNEVLIRQLRKGLEGVALPDDFVIAYEPVWAIGTGDAATGEQANEAIALIREDVAYLYGAEKAASVRIQYGGSVTDENAAEFLEQPEVDGALVGGASLKPDVFARIVEAAAEIASARAR